MSALYLVILGFLFGAGAGYWLRSKFDSKVNLSSIDDDGSLYVLTTRFSNNSPELKETVVVINHMLRKAGLGHIPIIVLSEDKSLTKLNDNQLELIGLRRITQ